MDNQRLSNLAGLAVGSLIAVFRLAFFWHIFSAALVRRLPDTQLVMLSEYTFNEPIPEKVRQWCKQQHVYLVAGGTAPAPKDNFYSEPFERAVRFRRML